MTLWLHHALFFLTHYRQVRNWIAGRRRELRALCPKRVGTPVCVWQLVNRGGGTWPPTPPPHTHKQPPEPSVDPHNLRPTHPAPRCTASHSAATRSNSQRGGGGGAMRPAWYVTWQNTPSHNHAHNPAEYKALSVCRDRRRGNGWTLLPSLICQSRVLKLLLAFSLSHYKSHTVGLN